MPQRTYNGIDLTNYQTLFDPGPQIPATPNTPSQGNASIFVSSTNPIGGAACISTLHVSGDFDFDTFPAIPANALISEIDFSWDANTTVSATSAGDGNESNVTGSCHAILGAVELFASYLNAADGPNSNTASDSESTAYNLHTVLEFDPPITKAQLEAGYNSILFAFGLILTGNGESSSITGTSGMDNFNLVITYEEGPISSSMTITPASGNVEPGQILVVTTNPDNPNAPNLEELTYAAITEDGKVIPIIPQFIYDPDDPSEVTAVWLETPYPAADPCSDCFPGCPECTEAFTFCDEDLTSEECQAAMQVCLDCLVECLEDLQEAEECQESSGLPPESPVPVVIIVSGGTQFSGNVTLGFFTIIIANGSGLYKFTLGQTHDILYTADRDGTTYNVKIPNPGGKTGFFRS